MGTTADKLNGILNSKNAIKTAIQNKGITVGDAKFSEYASKINSIITETEGIIFKQASGAKGVTSVQIIPSTYTSQWTDFFGTFYGCFYLTSISDFDTSNGTNFGYTFAYCRKLSEIPNIDTSKGTHFGSMFHSCESLTSIPQLNTSNGTNFSYMFYYCPKLISISNLNTSNGTNFISMFQNCSKLETVSSLDVSKGTNFTNMFAYCPTLTNLGSLTGLNKSIDLSGSTLLTHDSLINVLNGLATINDTQTLTLGETNLNKLTSEEKEIATNKGWNLN